MNFRQTFLIVFLLLFGLTQSGCASFNKKLKAWLNGKPSPTSVAAQANPELTKFSDSGDVSPRVRRQYKRTTKESLASESALDSRSGSLWVMEGQGAYLFAQNIVRLVGDPLAITLEGDPKDQIQSKVNVIRQLIDKIEERQKAKMRALASNAEAKDGEAPKDDKPADDKAAATTPPPTAPGATDLAVKTVPTRIVERMMDGNYRVKGLQPMMIGSREYKIIVTGIVKAEDFNEDGLSATKLLDSKFDIVSNRRKDTEL